jgi:hypothetical protein
MPTRHITPKLEEAIQAVNPGISDADAEQKAIDTLNLIQTLLMRRSGSGLGGIERLTEKAREMLPGRTLGYFYNCRDSGSHRISLIQLTRKMARSAYETRNIDLNMRHLPEAEAQAIFDDSIGRIQSLALLPNTPEVMATMQEGLSFADNERLRGERAAQDASYAGRR